MTTSELTFYALASIVFLALIYRIILSKSFAEKVPLYLFFLLYLALFSLTLTWKDISPLTLQANLILFFIGDAWLLSEISGRLMSEKHEWKSRLRELKKEKGVLYELIMAVRLLAQAGLGALIAIERRQSLKAWSARGVPVDALLSREILYSIFTPPGALHDGGATIEGGRIKSCAVIFPLTKSLHFPKDLGTRHRAALGLSEATDALCLIVSEESGTISFADRGFLYYDIPSEKLAEFLDRAVRFRLNNKKDKAWVQTYQLATA